MYLCRTVKMLVSKSGVTSELCPLLSDVWQLMELQHAIDPLTRYTTLIRHVLDNLHTDSTDQLLIVLKLVHVMRQRGHLTAALTLLEDMYGRVQTHVSMKTDIDKIVTVVRTVKRLMYYKLKILTDKKDAFLVTNYSLKDGNVILLD